MEPDYHLAKCHICGTMRSYDAHNRTLLPCAHEWEIRSKVKPWHLHPRWLDPAFWAHVRVLFIADETKAKRDRARRQALKRARANGVAEGGAA
jgi:hypothetical protein